LKKFASQNRKIFSTFFLNFARPYFFEKGKENFLFWIFAKSKKAEAELRFINIKKVNLLAPSQPVRANSVILYSLFDFSYCIEEKATSQRNLWVEPRPVRAQSARHTAKTLAIFANRRRKNRKIFGKFDFGAVIIHFARTFFERKLDE